MKLNNSVRFEILTFITVKHIRNPYTVYMLYSIYYLHIFQKESTLSQIIILIDSYLNRNSSSSTELFEALVLKAEQNLDQLNSLTLIKLCRNLKVAKYNSQVVSKIIFIL